VYRKSKEKTLGELEQEEQAKKRIDYWHTLMPYIGSRKLRAKLCDEDNIPIGRDLVRRYMREIGIRAVYPKPNLSKPAKGHPCIPYLLRKKAIYLPNQVWAVDITYIPLKRGHMYLTAVIDWYSRFIVGWVLSDSLETANIVEAIKNAIERYGVPGIINSDQGSQFTSHEYRELLKSHGIRQSMDGKARWIDNVIIERWFRSLKVEYVYINEYETPKELRSGIASYVSDYNRLRPHQSLNNMTPETVYARPFTAVG
jgi:putative transposase